MNTQTAENVELETVERTQMVQKYEALQRLKDNKDFQVVFLEGYLKEKAIASVSLLGTEYIVHNNLRAQLMEELVAISRFEGYMAMIDNLGAPEVVYEDEE